MDKAATFEKLEKIHNLPTLPQVITRLSAAVKDPNSDARRVAKIIEDDPSMMARILKVVNSAFYGAAEPVNSVQDAVARMGFVAVNNIALSTSVFSTFGKKGQTDFNREEFWRHSISVGIAANVLYARSRKNLSGRYQKDLLHLCGLLHDIGKIVLEQFMHDEFIASIQASQTRNIPLYQAEVEVMGLDHTEIGDWLAKKWNLSDTVAAVTRWHHDPAKGPREIVDLLNICHIANYICNLEKLGNGGDCIAPTFLHSVWKQLGLAVQDIADIVDEVKEESKQSEILLAFL